MRVLRLPIQKKWLDKIISGEKTSDYREIKPYWNNRLEGREYDEVVLTVNYKEAALYQIKKIEKTTETNDLGLPEVWAVRLGQQIKSIDFDTLADILIIKNSGEMVDNNTIKFIAGNFIGIYGRNSQLELRDCIDTSFQNATPEEVLEMTKDINNDYKRETRNAR